MNHYIEDNFKTAKAFIDSEDGKVFVSVVVNEEDKQYDFELDETELEMIKCLIEQGRKEIGGK
jgi:hypothetical protein